MRLQSSAALAAAAVAALVATPVTTATPTATTQTFANDREALYVRPGPGADLPLEHLLSDEEFERANGEMNAAPARQVSVRIAAEGRDCEDGEWTIEIMYATNSSEPPTETSCLCSSAKNNSNRAHGSGRAITYSNLISSTADYNLRSGIYTSPYLHRCAVQVDADTEYICNVGGRENAAHFITPPAAGKYPRVDPDQTDGIFSFAVIADGGQTRYSNATYHGALSWLRAKRASTLLYAGDLAYSDGEPLRWDSFGRLAEPLLSSVVTMWAPGNHELSAQEAYGGYLDRYGSTARELWFAERRGPVHFLSLCSYCRTEPGSAQFRWLELELEQASQGRDKTPWIIVQFHAPFYCSNPSHHEKAKPMRTGMEPLFVEHHVDLVISGHVHAYERTTPMQYGRPSTCGPTYVVVGDGGNREKASPFLRIGALAPSWSAFRQSSFGFASMEIQNATHANWTWHRNPHDFDHFPEQPITPLGSFAREDAVVMDRTDCRA